MTLEALYELAGLGRAGMYAGVLLIAVLTRRHPLWWVAAALGALGVAFQSLFALGAPAYALEPTLTVLVLLIVVFIVHTLRRPPHPTEVP